MATGGRTVPTVRRERDRVTGRDRSHGNRVGSLFSGVGGVDLGLERAGWEVTFQVENDPYCTAILETRWPNVPRYGDITDVDWDEVPAVDLLAGGFPCQPVSYAGRGAAQADARWLWPEFARAISTLRPRLILLENVPGLRGRGLDIVLGDLTALGYDAEWHTVPASALGAPHRRDRLWVVAYPYPSGLEVGVQPLLLGQRPTPVRDGWGVAESPMGRAVDGPARGLDRVAPWEGDTPRTTTDKPPYRVARLKALGNSVVPICAEWIGRQLLEDDHEDPRPSMRDLHSPRPLLV
jgi:DNA (cytosine-5)-methyltransferase 1